jgi:hypothetical protein
MTEITLSGLRNNTEYLDNKCSSFGLHLTLNIHLDTNYYAIFADVKDALYSHKAFFKESWTEISIKNEDELVLQLHALDQWLNKFNTPEKRFRWVMLKEIARLKRMTNDSNDPVITALGKDLFASIEKEAHDLTKNAIDRSA